MGELANVKRQDLNAISIWRFGNCGTQAQANGLGKEPAIPTVQNISVGFWVRQMEFKDSL
jgi:hypothetical protein